MKIIELRAFLCNLLRKSKSPIQQTAKRQKLPQEVLDLIDCPIGGIVRIREPLGVTMSSKMDYTSEIFNAAWEADCKRKAKAFNRLWEFSQTSHSLPAGSNLPHCQSRLPVSGLSIRPNLTTRFFQGANQFWLVFLEYPRRWLKILAKLRLRLAVRRLGKKCARSETSSDFRERLNDLLGTGSHKTPNVQIKRRP